MKDSALLAAAKPDHRPVLEALFESACRRLDHSPRFKYFTLHGRRHLSELVRITDLLIQGGIKLQQQEAYLLAAAICTHDIGMVTALGEQDLLAIFEGKAYATDPAVFETTIREEHHNLVEAAIRKDFSFFANLGISAPEMAQIIDISRCHRKTVLHEQSGFIQYLGALLRIIDELDIGPERAPLDLLSDIQPNLDPTSAWHWFKHGITERWDLHNNVIYRQEGESKHIVFQVRIHPASEQSAAYWLNQIRRPIHRALLDDGCASIIRNRFGVNIRLETDSDHSNAVPLHPAWEKLEEFALSNGRAVILVIDDESRKMDDLMVPTMDDYHVLFASNAKDAFDKLAAAKVSLAVIDLQIGSGFLWEPEQTADYKRTGIEIAKQIKKDYPQTRFGFLSGTRHDVEDELQKLSPKFFLKKPISGANLKAAIKEALL